MTRIDRIIEETLRKLMKQRTLSEDLLDRLESPSEPVPEEMSGVIDILLGDSDDS